MSSVAYLTLYIAIGAVLGILLGQIKYKGIGLGIGGVLFSGIIVGHFAQEYYGLTLRLDGVMTADGNILHYLQEFGLILFVYAIGVQVGPSFFSSLRGIGAKLIGLAVAIIFLNVIIAMSLYFAGIVQADAMIGMYTGAITNTPALGAGTSMLAEMANMFTSQGKDAVALGFDATKVSGAYAMAYPFAVCSLLIVMIGIRIIFRVSIDKAGEEYAASKKKGREDLIHMNVTVVNTEYFNKTLGSIDTIKSGTVICSRLKRNGELSAPNAETVLNENDILHLVGLPKDVSKTVKLLGIESKDVLTTHGTAITVRHLIVTKNEVMNHTLSELDLEKQYNIVISRVYRSGVQFMPSPDLRLALGDELNVIGKLEDVKKAGKVVGDSSATMNKVAMLPIFIGLFLGILLGSIPIAIPGVPTPLKLGVAGGPLIMAILLARFGDTLTGNRLHWRLPVPALSAFREIGITLFLTIVGISAGANGFFNTLTHGDGLHWMAWATLISFIPIAVVGFVSFKIFKVNYLVLSGMIAGSYTDPPALAYANGMYKDSEASSIGYATVYPFTMFLRILSPQIMLIIVASML